jgi:excinuclease ABC subunit B
MREAAADLEFETAARLRDEIKRLQETELFIADDPLARQETLRENVEQAVASSRQTDTRSTVTGATVRKARPAYRGRRRKGP